MFCVNKALKLHTSLVQNREANFESEIGNYERRHNMGKAFCLPNTKNLFYSPIFLPLLLTNLPSIQKREVNLNLLVPKRFTVQFHRNYYN